VKIMYGQQFSNPIASAAKWLFSGFVIILIMAFLLGGNIKDATWLNPNIADAEARRIQIESDHQQATYELQERKLTAQTEAEIRQIQREQEMLDAQHRHDLQVLDLDIANRQRWADFTVTAATFLGVGIGGVFAISILLFVIVKAIAILRTTPKVAPVPVSPAPRTIPEIQVITPLPERQPYEPLETPLPSMEQRQQLYNRRVAERFQEITQQKETDVLIARMKAVIDPARMSTTKYNSQPLAGD
jgi:hypothetical protein